MVRSPQGEELLGQVVASDLSSVSVQHKVHIPKVCQRIIDWPSQSSPVQLIAELIEVGRIRLYLESDVVSKIDALRLEIQQSESPDQLERIGVFNDRYRQVQFYSNEKMVRLVPAIVVYLGIAKGGSREVFVEARKSTLEIMSLQYRNQRLETQRDVTTI